MALILPYTSIDQFVPTTVHSDVEHNEPHNRLIANDIFIAAAFDTLESTVTTLQSNPISSILYTQAASQTLDLSITSTGTWVVVGLANFHCSNVAGFYLTMDGVTVQTLFGLGDPTGTDYASMFGFATKVVASAPYSFPCAIGVPPGGQYYAGSGRVGIIAFKTAV